MSRLRSLPFVALAKKGIGNLALIGLLLWSVMPTTQTYTVPVTSLATTTIEEILDPVSAVAEPIKNDEGGSDSQPLTAAEGQIVHFHESTDADEAASKLDVDEAALEQIDDQTYVANQGGIDETAVEDVASVDDNALFTILGRPNDEAFGNQIGVSNVNATGAWDLETGDTSTILAVLDTGVNGLHQDLFGKVIDGYDFVNDRSIGRNSDSDDHGHGTAVTSVAAAYGNNTLGLAGMAWNVSVMPIKVMNAGGYGTTAEVIKGIKYAIAHKASVIVMSIGSGSPSGALEDAVNEAWEAGVSVVASAGNDGAASGQVLFPARYPRVIAVGATTGTDDRADFSNIGLALDVVAPGVDIYHATDSDSEYARSSGTSFSAPFVAGAAALIKSRHPGASAEQIHDAIRDTADKVAGMGGAGRTDFYGYGRLNARRALEALKGDYQGKFVSASESIPALGSTQSWPVEFRYRNTGTSTWKRVGSSRLELATAGGTDRTLPFLREDLVTRQPSGWVNPSRVRMLEEQVRPNEVGTFRFWISVPVGMTGQEYKEAMQLATADGGVIADTTASFTVKVLSEAERYQAQLIGTSPNPTITANGSGRFQVLYKNTGNATWTKNTVKLGTARDHDRVSQFVREDRNPIVPSGWSSATRVSLDQDVVPPGQIGSFTFSLADTTSINPSTYREAFQPIAEGITWFGPETEWDITVQ